MINIGINISHRIGEIISGNAPVDVVDDNTSFTYVFPFVPEGSEDEFTAAEFNAIADKADSTEASINKFGMIALAANAGYTDTGDLLESVLFTGVIPGGILGPNGILDIVALMTSSADANDKTVRIKINGVTIGEKSVTTSTQNGCKMSYQLINRNSENAQIMAGPADGSANNDFINSIAPLQTYDIDTSEDMTITITGQMIDNAAASVTVEHVSFTTYFKA